MLWVMTEFYLLSSVTLLPNVHFSFLPSSWMKPWLTVCLWAYAASGSLTCFHTALVISLASIHAHTVCVYEPGGSLTFQDSPALPCCVGLCACVFAHKCARECFQASLRLRVEAENNVYLCMWRPEEDVRGSFFSLFLFDKVSY